MSGLDEQITKCCPLHENLWDLCFNYEDGRTAGWLVPKDERIESNYDVVLGPNFNEEKNIVRIMCCKTSCSWTPEKHEFNILKNYFLIAIKNGRFKKLVY